MTHCVSARPRDNIERPVARQKTVLRAGGSEHVTVRRSRRIGPSD